MILKHHLILTLCAVYGILIKVTAQRSKVRGSLGQQPLVQNVTVTEGETANMTCRVDHNDQTSLQWSNPAQQTLFFGDKKALRDHRIELVRASWSELTISINEVTLADEGMYTCSLFTMPVKTAKAYLTVLGVPEKPEIDGLTKPALEGDEITLTCMTHGSKPAADLRWFRNEKEIKGAKEVNASGRTFTVTSSLQLLVDRNDDGVAYTCKVDHVALTQTPQQATEVLEVHYAPRVVITHSLTFPQEGQYMKLECVSQGNPSPDPVLWTKDGGDLPDLDRMIVEGRELTFTALNKTDNGTYRCEASNHLGTSSAEYVLYVYDALTTPPPSTTPPPRPTPPDNTDPIDPHLASSDPTNTSHRDPNAMGQHGTDHALIGGVVAVVVFVTLCLIIVLGRYLARHKGTYLTNEAKGADDAPDADTAIINAEGNTHAEEKKEYFI
ncbi:cell adhesion molecule 2a isoform X1 [Esox lucius]|uniref:Ig-like domain-containing protein n=1 Tax=Esox lucius TaxID=8010 RepID=A0A6Q2Y8Z1_ESOLU|nr:cell adhesion molecule 2a isoform X1 [Esox lucius]